MPVTLTAAAHAAFTPMIAFLNRIGTSLFRIKSIVISDQGIVVSYQDIVFSYQGMALAKP
jgi:hypothetical protein